MPSIRKRVVVPANGEVANVVTGSAYERLLQDSLVEVFAKQGQGAGIGVAITDVQLGGQVALESGAIPQATGIPSPSVSQLNDRVMRDGGEAGDLVIVRLRETAGNAVTVDVAVEITPIR